MVIVLNRGLVRTAAKQEAVVSLKAVSYGIVEWISISFRVYCATSGCESPHAKAVAAVGFGIVRQTLSAW